MNLNLTVEESFKSNSRTLCIAPKTMDFHGPNPTQSNCDILHKIASYMLYNGIIDYMYNHIHMYMYMYAQIIDDSDWW